MYYNNLLSYFANMIVKTTVCQNNFSNHAFLVGLPSGPASLNPQKSKRVGKYESK